MTSDKGAGRRIDVDTDRLFGRGVTTPKVGEKPPIHSAGGRRIDVDPDKLFGRDATTPKVGTKPTRPVAKPAG